MGSCGGSYEFVWLLAYDACDILLGEVSIHLMGRVRG